MIDMLIGKDAMGISIPPDNHLLPPLAVTILFRKQTLVVALLKVWPDLSVSLMTLIQSLKLLIRGKHTARVIFRLARGSRNSHRPN